jgi:hypothetical protein
MVYGHVRAARVAVNLYALELLARLSSTQQMTGRLPDRTFGANTE